MIVDCHTHLWQSPDQLGQGAEAYLRRQSDGEVRGAPADHARACECVDRVFVLAFRSALLEAEVPNDFVARYVAASEGKAIGVAAVDPCDDGAERAAREALGREEFRALTVSPAAQGFHPADSRAMRVYAAAAEAGAAVMFCQGVHFPRAGRMEYARPVLLDEIAREFPDLRIVLSAMGDPWVGEGVALLGKHPNVYADISALVRRPWQAYGALVLAHQYNVMDKVLFASDFPYSTPARAIETVYRLHELTKGTNLPAVPREALRSMVERDALAALGIARPGEKAATAAPPTGELEEEEQ